MLAGPVPVGLGDVEGPHAAVVVSGEGPDHRGQRRHEQGRRDGVVRLRERDRLEAPQR